jgi:hypothetical protein
VCLRVCVSFVWVSVFYIQTSKLRRLKPEQGRYIAGREHVENGGVNRTNIQRTLVGMA